MGSEMCIRDRLQPAADAEDRLAGLDEGPDERHFVGVAQRVAHPVGVQRFFPITLRRHVVAALQHKAIQRLGVVFPAHRPALPMPTLWRGQVQVIPGAGHAPQWEQPAAFNSLLAAFVADCAGW